MIDKTVVAKAIEDEARAQLAAAYKEYPHGCDEDQMKKFLRSGKYPKIAWAIIMGHDYKSLIERELDKYGHA